MNKLIFLSTASFFVLLFAFQTSISSCTKTKTLPEKDTTLTAAILTANPWKLSKLRAIVGESVIYYTRGGANNSLNYDNEYITFNPDGTGTYTDNAGVSTPFTWHFTDASNTSLVWVWNVSTPITITWEDISYDDGAIRYTEYYVQNGNNVLVAGVRIPK